MRSAFFSLQLLPLKMSVHVRAHAYSLLCVSAVACSKKPYQAKYSICLVIFSVISHAQINLLTVTYVEKRVSVIFLPLYIRLVIGMEGKALLLRTAKAWNTVVQRIGPNCRHRRQSRCSSLIYLNHNFLDGDKAGRDEIKAKKSKLQSPETDNPKAHRKTQFRTQESNTRNKAGTQHKRNEGNIPTKWSGKLAMFENSLIHSRPLLQFSKDPFHQSMCCPP